jgi:AhpD family alkylhydroperoxidase
MSASSPSAPSPTDTTAPNPAVEEVRDLAKDFYGGFVPNQIKVLNEHSPAAARMYIATMDLVEQGELSDREREVVILAISRYNDCHYCTRTHAFLGREAGLSQETIEAVHRGGLPADVRLRALVQATRRLLDKRGWLDEEDLESLETEGIRRTELYEINTLIGLKIFSNYVNHIAQTEVDDVVTEHPDIQEMWPVLGTMDW